MVSAARAAKPPLSPSSRRARTQACCLVLGGQDAVADRQRFLDRQIHQRAGRFIGDDVEMIRLAADHGAERDKAVIVGAAVFGAVQRKGDHCRNFQRAGHSDDVVGGACLVERGLGAVEQGVGEVVVEARFDDQQMGFCGLAMTVSGVAGDLGRTEVHRKRFIRSIGLVRRHEARRRLRRLGEPRGIARHRVDFEVDAVADLACRPRSSRLKRVVDQKHVEAGALDLVDGQRGAVERDRALGRDEFGEIARRFEREIARRRPLPCARRSRPCRRHGPTRCGRRARRRSSAPVPD